VAEDKPYQSLYRKYRPQGPEEVLGQEHVIRALMGAVREGRLAHAFLFTGPRGTGKTSTARILAKMVNCEQGPTPEPCGTCEQCVRIREGTHLDVVEIDAASHGGVDDARELREKAPTAPVQGREKVYIIDEAQRLSREAFDALLKVFEEPPAGVRFVLATTEPHKMPPTIIGRCQRFDFRRIPLEVVAGLLQRIAADEGLALAPGAAIAIARQSEGSARDALSLMDQASVLGAGGIGEDIVASLVGAGDADVQHALADAVAVGDARAVFQLIEGRDLRHVTNETLTHFRNLLLARTAPEQGELLDVTEDEAGKLRAQASKFSPAELSRVLALLLAAQADMRWTTSPRLTFELALVRATIPQTDPQPQALTARIERLERLAKITPTTTAQPAEGQPAPRAALEPPTAQVLREDAERPAPPQPSPEGTPQPPPAESPERPEPTATEEPRAAEERAAAPGGPSQPLVGAGTAAVDVGMIRSSWGSLIAHLRSERKFVVTSFLEVATPAAYDGEVLELVFPPDRRLGATKVTEREGELRAALQALLGIAPRIHCVVRDAVAGASDPEDEEPPPSEEEALARLKAELGAQATAEGE
jgi:DNA polymerase-3 subunit gamma/tau